MRKYLAIFLLLLTLGGCSNKNVSGGASVASQTSAASEEQFSVPSTSDFQGTAVFCMTPEHFRNYFNSISEIELHETKECERDVLQSCGHFESGAVRYIFKIVPDMQNSSSITLYTPVGSDDICEVTVDFDDHAYSEQTLALYKEICFDVFELFAISCDDEMYTTLLSYADDNISETNFLSSDRREILFSEGNASLYSYFSYGEYSHVCIIPTD